ncbi:MAG: hypothetical protein IPP49_07225 [Saprospiraceae bacterium]|nr:hypothetical protein [Saprospiraceae bacterium]
MDIKGIITSGNLRIYDMAGRNVYVQTGCWKGWMRLTEQSCLSAPIYTKCTWVVGRQDWGGGACKMKNKAILIYH